MLLVELKDRVEAVALLDGMSIPPLRSLCVWLKANGLVLFWLPLLDRYSRTVVVRVDLHYRAVVRTRLRIEHVFEDMDRFIRARERNPIFKHETGYICSVEQGEDKGFHIHAAFFFNGAEVRSDYKKARDIGELWEQITRGHGYYYSCNEDKAKYGDEVGIGVILRRDIQAPQKVIKAMSYLAKDSQHLRMRPTGARAFRAGRVRRAAD